MIAAKSKPTTSAPSPTRQRILDASGELFRRQGYAGTGIKAVVAASHAPFGSLYHIFPGGKEELGVAALQAGCETYRELVELIFASGADVVSATRDFFNGAGAVLEETDYADACPIATVALEIASTNEPMREAAAAAFESWLAALTTRLVEAGIRRARARAISIELFCLVEGAFLLCRTTRDTAPMRVAGRAAVATVATTLAR